MSSSGYLVTNDEDHCYCKQLTWRGTAKNRVEPKCLPCKMQDGEIRANAKGKGPAPAERPPPQHPCYHPTLHSRGVGEECRECYVDQVLAEQVQSEMRWTASPKCRRNMLASRINGVLRRKYSVCGFQGQSYLCFCELASEMIEDGLLDILEKQWPGYKQWLYEYN